MALFRYPSLWDGCSPLPALIRIVKFMALPLNDVFSTEPGCAVPAPAMSLTAQRYDAFVKWLLDNGSVFNKLELRVSLSLSIYIYCDLGR